jgi:hypothetical protein
MATQDQTEEEYDDREEESTPEAPADDAGPTDEQFVASERKPINGSTIAILVILIAAAGGTYGMYAKAGLQKSLTPGANANGATITTFLNGGSGNLRTMLTMLHDTEKVVAQFNDYPGATQVPLRDLHSNPFFFVSSKPAPSVDLDAEAAKRKRDEERAAALKTVQTLQLQSVIVGTHSSCLINGHAYVEGQTVDDVTVEKVKAQSVIVRISGFRFELKMVRQQQ